MKRVLLLIAGSLAHTASHAEGAVTLSAYPGGYRVPRAAPPSAENQGDPPRQPMLAQDVRLEKRVTLKLKRSPLSEVVAELGRQTRIVLTAAPEVADEPTVLYATDQPLREVMHQLAALFHYRWTRRGKPEQYTYQIYQDLRSKQEEEALRQRSRQQALAALQAAIDQRHSLAQRSPVSLRHQADAIEAAGAAASQRYSRLSAEQGRAMLRSAEFRDLVRQDRLVACLREMADPFQRGLLRLATALTLTQWSALTSGEVVRFSTRQEPGSVPIPPALAAELRAARPPSRSSLNGSQFLSPEQEELFRQAQQQRQDAWERAEGLRVTVWLDLAPRRFGPLQLNLPGGVSLVTRATLSNEFCGFPKE